MTARLELRPVALFAEFGQQADAVQARHLQVGDHDGRVPGQNFFPGFQAVARGLGAIAPAGDQLGQAHQRVRFVFGNQDFYGVLHRVFFGSAANSLMHTADFYSMHLRVLGYAPEVQPGLFRQFGPAGVEGVVFVLGRHPVPPAPLQRGGVGGNRGVFHALAGRGQPRVGGFHPLLNRGELAGFKIRELLLCRSLAPRALRWLVAPELEPSARRAWPCPLPSSSCSASQSSHCA